MKQLFYWFLFLILLITKFDFAKKVELSDNKDIRIVNPSSSIPLLKAKYPFKHYHDDDELYSPIDISPSFLNPKKFFIKAPFNPNIALQSLFPGNYHRYYTDWDTVSIVTWTCKRCKKDSLLQTVNFSDSFNQTRVLDYFSFIDDFGHKFILLSTNTSNQTDEILMGRNEQGILGLALFESKNRKWNLVS